MKIQEKSEQTLRTEIADALKGLKNTRSPSLQNTHLDTCMANNAELKRRGMEPVRLDPEPALSESC